MWRTQTGVTARQLRAAAAALVGVVAPWFVPATLKITGAHVRDVALVAETLGGGDGEGAANHADESARCAVVGWTTWSASPVGLRIDSE